MKHKVFSVIILSSTMLSFAANAKENRYPNNGKDVEPPKKEFRYWMDDKGWFIGAEFLYWTVHELTNDFAITKDIPIYQDIPTNANDNLVGKFHYANFEWDPGVRAVVGYQFPDDHWELSARYTFFHTDGETDVSRPQNNCIQGSGSTAYTIGQLNSTFAGTLFEKNIGPNRNQFFNAGRAESHINFTYQVVELRLERHFLPSKNIVLGVFGAAQGAFFKQNWHVLFCAEGINQVTHFTRNWGFEGGGLQIGIDSDWYLGQGVCLFINGAASAVIGSRHAHNVTRPSSGVINNTLQKVNSHDTRFVTDTQLSFGFAWNADYRAFKYRVWAGYEVNIWNNVDQVYRFTGLTFDPPNADKKRIVEFSPVQIHGLIAGFLFHF